MQIVLVAPHFPPERVGGVELYTKRIADYLLALGHRPVVICVERIDADEPGVTATVRHDEGYPVHRLSFNLAAAPDAFQGRYRHPGVEAWMGRFFESVRPDLVHLQSGYLLGGACLNAAFSHGVPTIVTLHDFWFVCARITLLHPDGRRCPGPESAAACAWCLATEKRRLRLPDTVTGGRLGAAVSRAIALRPVAALTGWRGAIADVEARNRILRDALIKTDLVLAPSRFLRDLVAGAGLPRDLIVLSRLGLNVPSSLPPAVARSSRLRVGFLGQVVHHKGIHVLIDAVRLMPDAPLDVRIYGNLQTHGGYGEQLRLRAGGDPRIQFRGAYTRDAVYDILADLDTIVVPSIWYENAPAVIQEAHAAHVPVIASRLGGMREFVHDEADGLLFEPDDSRDLARQLRRLVDDPDLLHRLRPDGTSVRSEADEMQELVAHYARVARRRA